MGALRRYTGMSELEEGLLSGEIKEGEEEVKESGSGMSLSVAQPLVRDWLAKRRANLRPVGTFFNTANFQVPPSAGLPHPGPLLPHLLPPPPHCHCWGRGSSLLCIH